jgi:hypothetical protein
MIKCVVYAGILGFFILLNTTHARTLDLSTYMADRYERDCQVRLQPDLYNGNVSSLLRSYVLKDRQQQQGNGTLVSLNLNKVQYRNVPIVKIEYYFNPSQRHYSQELFFDLTSVTAKQNFSKIRFQQTTDMAIGKEGRFTTVKCSW